MPFRMIEGYNPETREEEHDSVRFLGARVNDVDYVVDTEESNFGAVYRVIQHYPKSGKTLTTDVTNPDTKRKIEAELEREGIRQAESSRNCP